MRFVAHLKLRDIVCARISVDDEDGQTPEETGAAARAALIRDANRHRHSDLSDALLDKIADSFAAFVTEHVRTKAAGEMMVRASASNFQTWPYRVALLPNRDEPEFLAYFESLDAAWLKKTEEFLGQIMSR